MRIVIDILAAIIIAVGLVIFFKWFGDTCEEKLQTNMECTVDDYNKAMYLLNFNPHLTEAFQEAMKDGKLSKTEFDTIRIHSQRIKLKELAK